MPSITILGAILDHDVAEGPFRLRVWPAAALEPTLKGYRRRAMVENHNTRPDGTPRKTYRRHGAKREKRGIVQCHEGINQKGNGGKR